MKILMDLFLLAMFLTACMCYFMCYHTTEQSLADKVGVGFLTGMTALTFTGISMFAVHDD